MARPLQVLYMYTVYCILYTFVVYRSSAFSSSHPRLLFLRQDKILDAKLRLDNTAINTAIACIPRWEIATEVLLSMSGLARGENDGKCSKRVWEGHKIDMT